MLFLGLDGGGTKTAFILINETGKILAYLTKPTCHYKQVGFERFSKVLLEGVENICQQAGESISCIMNY